MQNKTILITGAARRIGAHCARHLHHLGANIIIHCHHSVDEAGQLADELNHIRPNTTKVIQGDISNYQHLEDIAEQARRAFGQLNVLINNASTFYPRTFGDNNLDDWQSLVGSNMQGPFFLSQHLKKDLQQDQGVIINMLDIHAQSPLKNHTLYCMAKAAQAMMTKSLALELAPDIRVNGIAPGAIMWPENSMDNQTKQEILAQIPMTELGSAEDIAQAISYLIQAPYVTGQILSIDGGKSLN
ncbi:pteridine reductase [Neptunicella sp. SCSIO 80796]|uniref:pteridine reductase n=1 Tax=Neptunicella plasticusilytica TaxID=3117012 RepID=UPI003A4DAB92